MPELDKIRTLLTAHRKWVAAGAALVVFALVLLMARGIGGKDMSLLYSGLDAAAAGEVVATLEAEGAVFEVRGDAIYVEATQRDTLRMRLAAEGMPTSGTKGYELLDNLSGFGTTSQMFDAAYWRAKEGELARTILSGSNVRAARVHISTAGARPFATEQKPSAAVTFATDGTALNPAQIKALRFLVASAVSGLSPDDVSIIDSVRGLLDDREAAAGDTRAEALRGSVERMLEARVGYGNAVVEVALETVTESETIVEHLFDPASRVAISSDVQETTRSSNDSDGGPVTVASNLPTGDAAANGSSQSEANETRTLTNFEVSETQREVTRAPGAIRRMTVAVLLNETDPRSDEEIAALRDLVASTVGYDAARGDVITLHSLPFEVAPDLGTEAAVDSPLDVMRLAQLGVLAVVTLGLGLFVVRPILLGKPSVAALPEPEPVQDFVPPMAMALDMDFDLSDPVEDPAERLRRLIGERKQESMRILQHWVEDGAKA